MLIDYHIHTAMSGDARGEITDCIKIARDRGLAEIGFSDHYHPEKQDYSMNRKKLQEYIEKVQTFRKNNSFAVKLGLEVDFIPSFESKIEEILKLGRFDYVIGSVHFIDGWGFDNPKYIAEYQKWNLSELYRVYFDSVQKCAKSSLFDIIGHVDLIKKFGYKPKVAMTKVFKETVEILKECKVCVEVNTGGLRAPCMEIYPSKTFLKECFEEGVPITFGSDAHMPADVGRDFDRALELAKSVGYETIVRFSDRKPEHVQL